MSSSKELQKKHALECLRLAADCRILAQSVKKPNLKTHFLQMGDKWTALADQALVGPKIYRVLEKRTA